MGGRLAAKVAPGHLSVRCKPHRSKPVHFLDSNAEKVSAFFTLQQEYKKRLD